MEKTTHHEPVLVGTPPPQVIQRQITIEEAIPMLFNAVQQLNLGMQHFHERITKLETAQEKPVDENPST